MIDIDEGRRLLAAATPGLWRSDDSQFGGVIVAGTAPAGCSDNVCACGHVNGATIVWLRNNAAALLAELEAARMAIAEHNAGCEAACGANNEYMARRNACADWLRRGKECPECPRDWKIEGVALERKP